VALIFQAFPASNSGSFSNGGDLYADDGSYASIAFNNARNTSYSHVVGTFGLPALIPSGGYVEQVDIEIAYYTNITSGGGGTTVGIVGQISGSDQTPAATDVPNSSRTVITKSYTSGNLLNITNLANGTFTAKVTYTIGTTRTSGTLYVDYVKVYLHIGGLQEKPLNLTARTPTAPLGTIRQALRFPVTAKVQNGIYTSNLSSIDGKSGYWTGEHSSSSVSNTTEVPDALIVTPASISAALPEGKRVEALGFYGYLYDWQSGSYRTVSFSHRVKILGADSAELLNYAHVHSSSSTSYSVTTWRMVQDAVAGEDLSGVKLVIFPTIGTNNSGISINATFNYAHLFVLLGDAPPPSETEISGTASGTASLSGSMAKGLMAKGTASAVGSAGTGKVLIREIGGGAGSVSSAEAVALLLSYVEIGGTISATSAVEGTVESAIYLPVSGCSPGESGASATADVIQTVVVKEIGGGIGAVSSAGARDEVALLASGSIGAVSGATARAELETVLSGSVIATGGISATAEKTGILSGTVEAASGLEGACDIGRETSGTAPGISGASASGTLLLSGAGSVSGQSGAWGDSQKSTGISGEFGGISDGAGRPEKHLTAEGTASGISDASASMEGKIYTSISGEASAHSGLSGTAVMLKEAPISGAVPGLSSSEAVPELHLSGAGSASAESGCESGAETDCLAHSEASGESGAEARAEMTVSASGTAEALSGMEGRIVKSGALLEWNPPEIEGCIQAGCDYLRVYVMNTPDMLPAKLEGLSPRMEFRRGYGRPVLLRIGSGNIRIVPEEGKIRLHLRREDTLRLGDVRTVIEVGDLELVSEDGKVIRVFTGRWDVRPAVTR